MTRQMKDSGIPWIGEIPADWETCRLRFLCDIKTGNQDTQDNDPEGMYPFYVRSPIIEKSNIFTFDGEAILMAGDGVGAGKVFHYVDGKYGCHQRVYSLQHISIISRRLLYYYLQNRFYVSIDVANSKSTVDSVRLKMLQDFIVTVPPYQEQSRIADYLDVECAHIDAVIEQTRASIEEYKKLKQAVITQAVTKGIRPNRPMKDSGIEWIGDIPADWRINTVFQFFTHVKNKNSELKEKNLLSLSYGKIKRKNIETTEGLLPESFDGYNIIEADDIVLRLTDLQNDQKSLRVGISLERGIVTSAYVTIRNRSSSLSRYLYYYLHSFDVAKGFYGMGAGVRQGLNWDGLKWVKILTPSIFEQEEIVNYCDDMIEKVDALIAKKERLIKESESYKKSLIYEYVTGKKEVQ